MIGAGSTIGAFTATLGMDTKDYAKGILTAQGLNKVFGETFATFVANPLVGSVAIMQKVAGAAVAMGKAFASAAEQHLANAEGYQRLSQQLGVTEQLLIALEKRLQVAGAAGDIGHKSLQKFAVGLMDLRRASGPVKEVADALGLVIDPAESLDRNFAVMLDAINELPTAAQRSAAAAKVFGEEAGPKLINAIGGGAGAVRQMVDEMEALGFRVDKLGNDGLAGLNTQLGYTRLAIEGIKFNAMQSFFEGLTGGADGSTQSITQLAATINNSLGPSIRMVGTLLNPIVTNFPGVVYATDASLKGLVITLGQIKDTLEAINRPIEAMKDATNLGGLNPFSVNPFNRGLFNAEFRGTIKDTVLRPGWWVEPLF